MKHLLVGCAALIALAVSAVGQAASTSTSGSVAVETYSGTHVFFADLPGTISEDGASIRIDGAAT